VYFAVIHYSMLDNGGVLQNGYFAQEVAVFR